jgi:hypothetical protein
VSPARPYAVNACKLYCNIFVEFEVLTAVAVKNKFNIYWHEKRYSVFKECFLGCGAV